MGEICRIESPPADEISTTTINDPWTSRGEGADKKRTAPYRLLRQIEGPRWEVLVKETGSLPLRDENKKPNGKILVFVQFTATNVSSAKLSINNDGPTFSLVGGSSEILAAPLKSRAVNMMKENNTTGAAHKNKPVPAKGIVTYFCAFEVSAAAFKKPEDWLLKVTDKGKTAYWSITAAAPGLEGIETIKPSA